MQSARGRRGKDSSTGNLEALRENGEQKRGKCHLGRRGFGNWRLRTAAGLEEDGGLALNPR